MRIVDRWLRRLYTERHRRLVAEVGHLRWKVERQQEHIDYLRYVVDTPDSYRPMVTQVIAKAHEQERFLRGLVKQAQQERDRARRLAGIIE